MCYVKGQKCFTDSKALNRLENCIRTFITSIYTFQDGCQYKFNLILILKIQSHQIDVILNCLNFSSFTPFFITSNSTDCKSAR